MQLLLNTQGGIPSSLLLKLRAGDYIKAVYETLCAIPHSRTYECDQLGYLAKALTDSGGLLQHVAENVAGLPNDEVIRIEPSWAGIKHLQLLGVPDGIWSGVSKPLLPQTLTQERIPSCDAANFLPQMYML